MKSTQEKILDFIKNKKKITPSEISDEFLLGRAMVHRHLKNLIEKEKIEKEGSAPRVFYLAKKKIENIHKKKYEFSDDEKEILDENFLYITAIGKRMTGNNAFIFWCDERNFDVEKKVKEYLSVLKKYKDIKKNGFYNATSKIKNSFSNVCVEKLLYLEFNSLEIFGRTKLGQMVLYAKQNQDRREMRKIVDIVKKDIFDLIGKEKIDSIVFVPPTVKREYQFMKFIEKELKIQLPVIKVTKKKNDVAVPQKTLRKLSDRKKNAEATFEVLGAGNFKKTLIIDDAVGSGSTINEIACKIKDKKISKKIIGISLVGSLNGFEVISEV